MIEQLRAIPPGDSYPNDMALNTAWKREADIDSCGEASQFAERVNTARARLGKVHELKKAIDAADAGTGSEEALVKAANQLPARYTHPYTSRVLLGDNSIRKLMALRVAVEEKPPSDRRIAAAVDELRVTNLELLGRLDRSGPGPGRQRGCGGGPSPQGTLTTSWRSTRNMHNWINRTASGKHSGANTGTC